MQSYVNPDEIAALNEKVYQKAVVDREHLLEFLTLIKTNDAQDIIREVKTWLTNLHEDPKFDKVRFPQGDIDAIIGDLDSYGRVQAEHLFEYKSNSSRTVPMS